MAAAVREECCSEDEHSPTDTSEDSVEVKVLPIALAKKNKRKLAEPRKVANEKRPPGSLTPHKRPKLEPEDTSVNTVIHPPVSPVSCSRASNPSPFRPWSQGSAAVSGGSPLPTLRGPSVFVDHPGLLIHDPFRPPSLIVAAGEIASHPRLVLNPRTFGVGDHSLRPPSASAFGTVGQISRDDEPLSLVLKSEDSEAQDLRRWTHRCDVSSKQTKFAPSERTCLETQAIASSDDYGRPHSPQQNSKFSVESLLGASSRAVPTTTVWSTRPVPASRLSVQDSPLQYTRGPPSEDDERLQDPSTSVNSSPTSSSSCLKQKQRNYKNMTRERRIEANARERTRVHTISAAFDTLRQAIPSYSHNQKLSKLSILRIACSYILTLSRVAGKDYSHDQSAPSLADCVDLLSRTIQTEGKVRKKKDDC